MRCDFLASTTSAGRLPQGLYAARTTGWLGIPQIVGQDKIIDQIALEHLSKTKSGQIKGVDGIHPEGRFGGRVDGIDRQTRPTLSDVGRSYRPK
jgi:hypothetical protein